MKQLIRITEADLHAIVSKAIQAALQEGFGVDRPKNAQKGMAKSLMGQDMISAYNDNGANDRNSEAARRHGQGGQFGRQETVGRKRAVSSYDPLALRQEMNKLGNDPQDTLRKSRKYGHLNINNK